MDDLYEALAQFNLDDDNLFTVIGTSGAAPPPPPPPPRKGELHVPNAQHGIGGFVTVCLALHGQDLRAVPRVLMSSLLSCSFDASLATAATEQSGQPAEVCRSRCAGSRRPEDHRCGSAIQGVVVAKACLTTSQFAVQPRADLNAAVYNGHSRDLESGLLHKQLGEPCTVAVACAHTLLMS